MISRHNTNKTTVIIKMDTAVFNKIAKIAEDEIRPISMQILIILRDYIESYEKEHGEIDVSIITKFKEAAKDHITIL